MRDVRLYPVSLGCPKNHALLELLLSSIKASNSDIHIVLDPDDADFFVINSCGFIAPAVLETVETAIQLRNSYPDKKIILTGCVPQRFGVNEVKSELPEVDFVLDIWDTAGWKRILGLQHDLYIAKRPYPLTFPYAYVNIGEGCSLRCSYCTIPLFKGDYVSRPLEDILEHVRSLEDNGYVEAILVSQDCASYGVDLSFDLTLPDLLSKLHDATEDILFRVLYLNPRFLRPEWLRRMSKLERFIPYFDIPLQHLSDRVLQAMRRGYTFEHVVRIVDSIREVYGDRATIRTTLMVGFPTETDRDLEEMLDRVQSLSFDWIGVFRFYPEDGTPAANMPQLPEKEISHRYEIVQEFVRDIVEERAKRWIGKRVKMVVTNVLENGHRVADYGYPLFCAPEIDKVAIAENGDFSDMGGVVEIEITDYGEDVFRGRVVGS